MPPPHDQATIVARSTAQGGAIAIVRLSGKEAIALVNSVFHGADLLGAPANTAHVGMLYHGQEALDEVVVTLFRAPRSFTAEDLVEIGCHGSPYIIARILNLMVAQGARLARPGEFTQRAFLHGRLDLAQASAIADLIAAESAAAHRVALSQMRGHFSKLITTFRQELIHFAALLTLELDFVEEDVAFADRAALTELVEKLQRRVAPLIESFALGNVIKKGLPVVIAGAPNVGKSTLLNALLGEARALVTPLAGTTRDVIEGQLQVGGVTIRFMDTAGLRNPSDEVEALGIARTHEKIATATLVLYVVDLGKVTWQQLIAQQETLRKEAYPYLLIGNKVDQAPHHLQAKATAHGIVMVSAKEGANLASLQEAILTHDCLKGLDNTDAIVVNARHHACLCRVQDALGHLLAGVAASLPNEMLVADLEEGLQALGEITGAITTEHILDDIFHNFCIGK